MIVPVGKKGFKVKSVTIITGAKTKKPTSHQRPQKPAPQSVAKPEATRPIEHGAKLAKFMFSWPNRTISAMRKPNATNEKKPPKKTRFKNVTASIFTK